MKLSIDRANGIRQYFKGDYDFKDLKDEYQNVTELEITGLKYSGYDFLCDNKTLKKISLPSLKTIESGFLQSNVILEEIKLPEVEKIGLFFLEDNIALINIDLPKVQEIDAWFLHHNKSIRRIYFPEVKIIGDNFMNDNEAIEEVVLPNVVQIGEDFLYNNRSLTNIYVPNLTEKGKGFLAYNHLYNRIIDEVDLSFRKLITQGIKEKILEVYNIANKFHDQLNVIQTSLKDIENDFGKDFGKDTNVYHHDACFALHRKIIDFTITTLISNFGNKLYELSDLFKSVIDFNSYINDLLWGIRDCINLHPDVTSDIIDAIKVMSESINIYNKYESYTIFENKFTYLSNLIQDITRSVTKAYFLTIKFVFGALGQDEAQKLLKRSVDDILKNIAFSIVIDERFLSFVSGILNGKELESHSLNELMKIESQIYDNYDKFIKEDFFKPRGND